MNTQYKNDICPYEYASRKACSVEKYLCSKNKNMPYV